MFLIKKAEKSRFGKSETAEMSDSKLAVVKICVKSVLFEQLFMIALLDDVSVLHN